MASLGHNELTHWDQNKMEDSLKLFLTIEMEKLTIHYYLSQCSLTIIFVFKKSLITILHNTDYIHSPSTTSTYWQWPWPFYYTRMMMIDMETRSTLLALCEWNPSVSDGFPHKGPVIQTNVFFVLKLNKLLNKQYSYQWLETHWCRCLGDNVIQQ